MDEQRTSSATFIMLLGFGGALLIGSIVTFVLRNYLDHLRPALLLGLAAGMTVWFPMMALALMEWNRERDVAADMPRPEGARAPATPSRV